MRIFLKIVFVVAVAALIIGAGVAVFNAGMAQGIAMSGQVAKPDGAVVPVPVSPYYAPYYGPWGFGPGGWCFGLFGFLLIIFLIAGLGRLAFGPRHGWHRGPWGMGGPRGYNGEQVPPFVEEAHRKMHEKMSQPPAPPV